MYNILICDDQPDIVNAHENLSVHGRYRLFEAYTGRQAVEHSEGKEIHLILMDIIVRKWIALPPPSASGSSPTLPSFYSRPK